MEFRKGPVENLALTQDFWLGRRVFVTGHTGFKGSWLCLTLKLLGAKIHGYALKPPTEPNLFEVADVERGMTSTIGDVRDYQTLKNSLEACNPEVVFHLAAQPLVRESYETPVETYATNVMGSVHLFEAIRHLPMASRTIVNITSDKCYENTGWVWGYRDSSDEAARS